MADSTPPVSPASNRSPLYFAPIQYESLETRTATGAWFTSDARLGQPDFERRVQDAFNGLPTDLTSRENVSAQLAAAIPELVYLGDGLQFYQQTRARINIPEGTKIPDDIREDLKFETEDADFGSAVLTFKPDQLVKLTELLKYETTSGMDRFIDSALRLIKLRRD